jgi:ureidoglycolate lyase
MADRLHPAVCSARRSASLGAGRFTTFRRITLPLIAPGHCRRCFPVVHCLDRQRAGFSVPVERPHRYVADPHLGYDGVGLGCAGGCSVGCADHKRRRSRGGHGAPSRSVAAHLGVCRLKLIVEPLAAGPFAPFGDVLEIPHPSGRNYFDRALANLRPGARPSLSLSRKEELSSLPLTAQQMERHEFSSQSFVPIDVGRWVVVVAPHAAGGGPDMGGARAFLAGPNHGVTYAANVWHHPLTILDRPASFAVFMWRDGGKATRNSSRCPRPPPSWRNDASEGHGCTSSGFLGGQSPKTTRPADPRPSVVPGEISNRTTATKVDH